MTLLNISHISVCLGMQALAYALTRDWVCAAIVGPMFYLGREVAQAEYRCIEGSPSRLRKDMPVMAGVYPQNWTAKSFIADMLVPTLLVVCTSTLGWILTK
jgi:hypothetical protein